MITVDHANFVRNCRQFLRQLADGTIGNVMEVIDGDDESPLIILIRHQQYAPKLDRFNMTPSGDLICSDCLQIIEIYNPYNLDAAAKAANEHWRNTHRKAPK